jgi:Trk K+ transport system NAD-binding subunit
VVSYSIEPALPVCRAAIAGVPFPEQASLMMLVGGRELIAPRGGVVLEPGDHVYVLCRREDRPLVDLLFGKPEE